MTPPSSEVKDQVFPVICGALFALFLGLRGSGVSLFSLRLSSSMTYLD